MSRFSAISILTKTRGITLFKGSSVLAKDASDESMSLTGGLRGRDARRLRALITKMEPVVLMTPKWSNPRQFLDEMALELALGEPAIGCRTVSFQAVAGRGVVESRQLCLHILGQIGRRGWTEMSVAMVSGRDGFRMAVLNLLELAHRESRQRLVLVGHDADALPAELVDDLSEAFFMYRANHPEGLRCTIVLSAAQDSKWLNLGGSERVTLSDYDEAEATLVVSQAHLSAQTGSLDSDSTTTSGSLSDSVLTGISNAGGIPAAVDALTAGVASGRSHGANTYALCGLKQIGSNTHTGHVNRELGVVYQEMREVIHMVSSHGALSDRLHMMKSLEIFPEAKEVDHQLTVAGLLRREQRVDGVYVSLRAPMMAPLIR